MRGKNQVLKPTMVCFAMLCLGCTSSSVVGGEDDSSTDTTTVLDTETDSSSNLDTDTDIDTDTDTVDSSTEFEDFDSDGWFNEFDCDDENPAVHPDATEIYDPPNNIDDDCDGLTDEEPWEDPNARAIPTTCAEAAEKFTSLGCKFYAVDLPNMIPGQYSIAVANVQLDTDANVVVEVKESGSWGAVKGAPPATIDPLDLHYFDVPHRSKGSVGIMQGGAYRVTSDIPVAVYQFNPLDSGSFSSDASMLYPVTALDTAYDVINVGDYQPYFSVLATVDATRFEITPTLKIPLGSGGNPPPTLPGVTREMQMNEGDVLFIRAQDRGNYDGTTIRSDHHPLALFTGHVCHGSSCDHLEEQLSGLRSWGKKFVAPNLPVRDPPPYAPEATKWRIYAAFDDTEVTITAPPELTKLPASPLTLQGGETEIFLVSGTLDVPGDFLIESNEPIAVISTMTGSGVLQGGLKGDPLAVQIPPSEQFLPRYVVLVPSERAWPEDFAVITRPTRSEVRYDGVPIPNSEFTAVGSDWEVARYRVTDGVHDFESDKPFGIVVVGTGLADSYGYIGGVGTKVINHTIP